ncbi:MAG: glycine cleavage system protein H [Deltaproteobacteria bacterium]|nr:glycine cleavage system protein H [Deltaproteobacteria bacterium]
MKAKGNKPSDGKKRVVSFQVVENQCIWAKAGVINYRVCDNAYDCNTCGFDKAMSRAGQKKPEDVSQLFAPGWSEELRSRYIGANRPCRHALTGRINAPKICPLNNECYHCAFDQWLDEVDLSQELDAPKYRLASGFKIAEGYYYHMGHTWVRFEHGGVVRVGFDDFLSRVFGTMSSVALPSLGRSVSQDKVGWSFAREQHEASVLCPVTGKVLAVNHAVMDHPEIAHKDPYQHGWLMIIEPNMPKRNLKGLYYGDESVHWMEQEQQKLMGILGPEYAALAATGAEVVDDVFGNCEGIEWNGLVDRFLHTSK